MESGISGQVPPTGHFPPASSLFQKRHFKTAIGNGALHLGQLSTEPDVCTGYSAEPVSFLQRSGFYFALSGVVPESSVIRPHVGQTT